jgi:hypothetical protein
METKLKELSTEASVALEAAAAAVNSSVPPLPFEILSFCVALPPSAYQGWDEPEIRTATTTATNDNHNSRNHALQAAAAASATALLNQQGIVGTIIILKKAVMIWFGWGKLISKKEEEKMARNDNNTTTPTPFQSNSITVGSGTNVFF